MRDGIHSRRIADTPVAIIDFETTGLTPGYDLVVEVCVVRVDPGERPRVVFDTLVNPGRPMAATEIHGITDADVISAPHFSAIAGELLAATKGCVIAAYNVYFDIKFLHFELSKSGVSHKPPHFCLMYLRPMLGLGPRCRLEEACRSHGIAYQATHVAADDALAAGNLFCDYLGEINRRGVNTFAELSCLKEYKFNDSFSLSPFPDPSEFGLCRCENILSRAALKPSVDPIREATVAYWDALKAVLADLEINDDELQFVQAERIKGGLKEEQIRALHARAFASVIAQFANDQWIDDREARKLRRLNACLARLGWAPGL